MPGIAILGGLSGPVSMPPPAAAARAAAAAAAVAAAAGAARGVGVAETIFGAAISLPSGACIV